MTGFCEDEWAFVTVHLVHAAFALLRCYDFCKYDDKMANLGQTKLGLSGYS